MRASTVSGLRRMCAATGRFCPYPRQAPDALVEPHRVPRHVDVDQRGAALLQVDALAAGLGRDEKTHVSLVEHRGRLLARLTDGCGVPLGLLHAGEPVVAVDERRRSEAELALQSIDDQRLRRLVLGEQKHGLVRRKPVAEHRDQPLDLRLHDDLPAQDEQFLDAVHLVPHQQHGRSAGKFLLGLGNLVRRRLVVGRQGDSHRVLPFPMGLLYVGRRLRGRRQFRLQHGAPVEKRATNGGDGAGGEFLKGDEHQHPRGLCPPVQGSPHMRGHPG